MAIVASTPLTNNPVPSWKGRLPVVSSGFRNPDRPDHIGVDQMYKRLAEDGGPPGKALEPSYAPRFYMPTGIPALAAGPGRVVFSGVIGTGGHVKIDHAGGWRSEYMHLLGTPSVKEGAVVRGGDVIGTINYNPIDWHLIHMHFQLRKDGQLVDPGPIVAGLPVLAEPGGSIAKYLWIGAVCSVGVGLYWYLTRKP